MSGYQRRKGAAGEREFFALASAALNAEIRRKLGQAREGGEDGEYGALLFEVKRRHKIAALRWIDQVRDAALRRMRVDNRPRIGVVAMREDGGDWFILLSAEAFFTLAAPEIARLMPEEVHSA